MIALIILLGFAMAGAVFGGIAKPSDTLVKLFFRVQLAVVYVIVAAMGIKTGADPAILGDIGGIGLESLLFVVCALAGSFAVVKLLEKLVMGKSLRAQKNEANEVRRRIPPSIWLALVLAAGIFAGWLLSGYKFKFIDDLVMVLLAIILFIAGVDIVRSKDTLRYLRQYGFKVLIVPAGVCIGSVLGTMAASLLTQTPLLQAASVGAGLGWYTYSGAALSTISVRLGTIAFLTNFMRELFTYLFVPVVAKRLGPFCAVAMPGSPAMDTTLPFIVRHAGKDAAIVCFVSGILCTIITPVCFAAFLAI